MRLLLFERAGLLLSNLVVPYEITRITGAAMGFVPRGGFFQLPTQYDTRCVVLCVKSNEYMSTHTQKFSCCKIFV